MEHEAVVDWKGKRELTAIGADVAAMWEPCWSPCSSVTSAMKNVKPTTTAQNFNGLPKLACTTDGQHT